MASSERPGDEGAVSGALSDVVALYSGSLAEHGVGSKAVGWPDRESQLLRFEKLAYLVDLDRPAHPVSVNDWGCGYGAMFSFLDERPGVELEAYNGYDISADMLAAARAQVPDPRAHFHNASEMSTVADYTFVSGTFNVRSDASEADWAGYVKGTLAHIAERSRRGFAFNLLTTYVDWREDILFYGDPAEFFDYCRQRFSRYVTVLHDYPLYEWTIVVRQDAEGDDA